MKRVLVYPSRSDGSRVRGGGTSVDCTGCATETEVVTWSHTSNGNHRGYDYVMYPYAEMDAGSPYATRLATAAGFARMFWDTRGFVGPRTVLLFPSRGPSDANVAGAVYRRLGDVLPGARWTDPVMGEVVWVLATRDPGQKKTSGSSETGFGAPTSRKGTERIDGAEAIKAARTVLMADVDGPETFSAYSFGGEDEATRRGWMDWLGGSKDIVVSFLSRANASISENLKVHMPTLMRAFPAAMVVAIACGAAYMAYNWIARRDSGNAKSETRTGGKTETSARDDLDRLADEIERLSALLDEKKRHAAELRMKSRAVDDGETFHVIDRSDSDGFA